MNKRGISPLIATVLLVAFSIALAAIVSNYVIQKTKEFKPEKIVEDSLLCDEVNLGYSIDPVPSTIPASNWLCTTITSPEILAGINIVNKGKFSVYKYSVSVEGKTIQQEAPAGSYDNNNHLFSSSPILPGQKQPMFFGITGSNSDYTIRIVPIVKNPEVENEFVKCTRSALTIDYIQLKNDINNNQGFTTCMSLDEYKINPNNPTS